MDDDEGQTDAINYLLSGPSGLGQNFAGYSSYAPVYLTGNFRIPFTQVDIANLYVAPITLGTTEMLDDRTVKLTFASAQATPPFSLGNGLTVSGISTAYNNMLNDNGVQIGVVSCTTTYVIVRLQVSFALLSPATGGTVEFYTTGNFFNSTDCDSRVTVTGGTDRVFLSGQLDNLISYDVISSPPATLEYTAAIRRYTGFINTDPTNPDYLFASSVTIAEKVYTYTGLTSTGTLDLVETVFATFIDQPPPGYYRYILEVKFRNPVGDLQVTSSEFGLRSISCQVVKQ